MSVAAINMQCMKYPKTMKIDKMTEGKRSVVYQWTCPACNYKTISIEEK